VIDCAAILKVLADPTRLRVIEALMEGPKRVAELNRTLQLDQSLLSHHLKVLRDARLVCAYRDGKAVRYELAPEVGGKVPRKSIELGCCRLSFH